MDNRERFEALFRDQYPGLVRELRLVLRDPAGAEEAAAEAFVVAWRSWAEVVALDRPGAWIRMVAIRHASRQRWRLGRRAAIEATHAPKSVFDEAIDMDLVAALQKLSDAQRTAVVLHHLGGWSTEDVGTILGCPEATVRSHLRRGRLRLAGLLRNPDDEMEVSNARPR